MKFPLIIKTIKNPVVPKEPISKIIENNIIINDSNIWILKPGENTNRGNGIQVCSSLAEIKEIISGNMYEFHKRTFILQKYIERPQLYKNRKFDIRCYGLLTSVNGNLKGFFYDPDIF